MENNQPTNEPQTIETQLAQALDQLQSRSASFKTTEEADEAWRMHRAAIDGQRRLIEAGFPRRHVDALPRMNGPGLEFAQSIDAAILETGSLFLIGDRGPGKTQIATWIGAKRIADGKSCGVYRKALDLWSEIKGTWSGDSKTSEADVLRRFKCAAFLVIDEAQERGDTENDRQWCDRTFAHIMDHRYDASLPTIICANLDRESFNSTIPASIRSRMSESGGLKVCDWPSYRK